MGNARSSARRSVGAFGMEEESSSSMYSEPLLPVAGDVDDEYGGAYQRKSKGAVATAKQLQFDGAWKEEPSVDLAAVVHQLNSFYAVVWPVAITMVLASLAACNARDPQMAQAMSSYMYYRNIDSSESSLGEKSMLALTNALFVIGFIACLTFAIVLLYKFNCMRFFLGYCTFYSASLLALAGTKIVVVVLGQEMHLVFDSVSHWFVMYNFAVVGVLSIFYQKGIPTVVEQGYLVAISVIVAWQLSQLPEWSVWMILLLLGFWDLFAVLTPIGPLRWLVDLVHEKGTPLPGLLFRADVTDSHQDEAPRMASMEPTRARMPESEFISWLLSPKRTLDRSGTPPPPAHVLGFHHQVVAFLFDQRSTAQYRALDISQRYANHQTELWLALYTYYDVKAVSPPKPYPSMHLVAPRSPPAATPQPKTVESDPVDEDKSIRLGLGDFIFYSVLVARAALHGVATFAACFLCVIAGLGATMYLLAHYDALPALPISVFSGILAYLLMVLVLSPLVQELTSFGIVSI